MLTNYILCVTTCLIGKTEAIFSVVEDPIGSMEVFVEEQMKGLEKGLLDVLEAIDRKVIIEGARTRWTYATVGQGIDIIRRGWPQERHVFSSQSRDVSKSLPGRPNTAQELGPPKKVRATILNKLPVDFLFIDDEAPEVWSLWLIRASFVNRPQVFAWMGPGIALVDEGQGPVSKSIRKNLERMGYRLQYFLLSAEKLGAGIAQDRLVLVGTLMGPGWSPVHVDDDFGLPRRSMSNLLMPVGVPRQAWHYGLVHKTSCAAHWLPCDVLEAVDNDPIFERHGLMPDRPHSWIRSERGIRRLQHQELAKGKGVPSDWMVGEGTSQPLREYSVKHSSCLHLWTTVLDAVAAWNRRRFENNHVSGSHTPSTTSLPPAVGVQADTFANAKAVHEIDPWTWDVPDLSEGSQWYQERLRNLQQAVTDLPDGEIHFINGLEALRIHRDNYSMHGPKKLQILWWEFPPEHWTDLREGSRMNFLITPRGELKLNAAMDDESQAAAGKFVDELKSLGVLLPAQGELHANCPLFCVDKVYEPGKKRCIADMKTGGQNRCIGKDPVYLIQSQDILPQLYPGGYSAVADVSKFFHNFPTHPEEHQYLGCIHPITDEKLIYATLPMGSSNSPAVACRIGNSCLRQLKDRSSTFHGKAEENTWKELLAGEQVTPDHGYGRVEIGTDGLPVALIWGMVDDFLVHAPTKEKCYRAFSEFMDNTVRLGLICQKVKTSPPAQVQKFCGMLYDSTGHPCIRLPDAKVSRSLATIAFVERQNLQSRLSRLTVSIMGGLLQSLVDSTPQRQGQTYLRSVYNELHGLDDLYGRALFHTAIHLTPAVIADLGWWKTLLHENPGNRSRTATFGTLVVTWGDGSGTGTGGTLERVQIGQHDAIPEIETWMGAWAPQVFHFDSNWKELRTLLWTLQRCLRRPDRHIYRGTTLFYFTDNMVSYYVVQNGSSSSPELHKLTREIKACEVRLGCRIEAIHVPGDLMILVGPDDLSRGIWMSPERHTVSSVLASHRVLQAIPFCPALGDWALKQAGLPSNQPFRYISSLDEWTFDNVNGHVSIWTPAPELARQALRFFLDSWVEAPWTTAGLFMIPRILQRDWAFLSKHVRELVVIYPHDLPLPLRYASLIPLVLLYFPFYVRALPVDRLDQLTDRTVYEQWHQQQAELVRGLS
jgi:hypothetical protein